jgi:hypothetical protein
MPITVSAGGTMYGDGLPFQLAALPVRPILAGLGKGPSYFYWGMRPENSF